MNNNADAINIEHRNMLVELFHKIRMNGYTHDKTNLIKFSQH